MISIVMPTYQRNAFLEDPSNPTFELASLSEVEKLIIVWHNIGDPVPASVLENISAVGISDKVIFVYPKKNSLNNRFKPWSHITTDCVFSIDDDYLCTELAFKKCYELWSNDNEVLVGITPRLIDPPLYTARPRGRNTHPFTALLTQGAMFHKRFLSVYSDDVDNHAIVDQHMNGEDLVFNFIHRTSSTTSALPIYVHDDDVRCWANIPGKSIHDRPDHYDVRLDIWADMERKYGKLQPSRQKHFIRKLG